jgi:hypothetical protein
MTKAQRTLGANVVLVQARCTDEECRWELMPPRRHRRRARAILSDVFSGRRLGRDELVVLTPETAHLNRVTDAISRRLESDVKPSFPGGAVGHNGRVALAVRYQYATTSQPSQVLANKYLLSPTTNMQER